MRRVTLRQLRIFECAARQLHFGRAARELHLTQPAVSLQMKQLEGLVGLPLFEQIGRCLHLTRAGEQILDYGRKALELQRQAEEAVNTLKGTGGGELRIAVLSTGKYLVPQLLAEFRRQHPAMRVTFAFNNREAVVREVSGNTVDLAIMGGAPQGIGALAIPFALHPLAFVAAPQHPLATRRRMPLARLKNETFIIRERGSGTRSTMERLFAQHAFRPAETIEISSNETIKQAVMAGMGVSFLSLHTMGLELAAGKIAVLAVQGTPVMREWNVVHLKRKRLSPAATAFKAFVLARGADLIRRAAG
ncbi:MAG: LysR family transcriptional regulator [Betaproteobacteria bacterium]|nr:LysR family transcriptional regulator [Betaproteobacteria bacterium]